MTLLPKDFTAHLVANLPRMNHVTNALINSIKKQNLRAMMKNALQINKHLEFAKPAKFNSLASRPKTASKHYRINLNSLHLGLCSCFTNPLNCLLRAALLLTLTPISSFYCTIRNCYSASLRVFASGLT